MRWLERYLVENSPRLEHFAKVAASLVPVRLGSYIHPSCLRLIPSFQIFVM
jgi:hypothetical protein